MIDFKRVYCPFVLQQKRAYKNSLCSPSCKLFLKWFLILFRWKINNWGQSLSQTDRHRDKPFKGVMQVFSYSYFCYLPTCFARRGIRVKCWLDLQCCQCSDVVQWLGNTAQAWYTCLVWVMYNKRENCISRMFSQ